MEYKISELVSKTGVPKSTILYYIREGLLPQAQKLKPNVHRYSDEHIELIKYISYMKENFQTSNEHLKNILQNRNQSFSSSSSMITPLMNTLSSVSPDDEHYTKEAFTKRFHVDEALLETLLQDEILTPLGENDFTEKEASMVKLVSHYLETGIDYDILRQYVFHAKSLSLLEHRMQMQLCDIRNDENFSTLWKIVFETLFTAKAYIFNRQTYRAFFSSLKNELS